MHPSILSFTKPVTNLIYPSIPMPLAPLASLSTSSPAFSDAFSVLETKETICLLELINHRTSFNNPDNLSFLVTTYKDLTNSPLIPVGITSPISILNFPIKPFYPPDTAVVSTSDNYSFSFPSIPSSCSSSLVALTRNCQIML